MLIDKRLFPDAESMGERYSNYNKEEKRIDVGGEMPFIRAFEDLDPSVCVLLCGMPSIGKSIACRILNAKAMIERKHVYWFRCKGFSSAEADYLSGLSGEDYDQTVILDGYEELPDEDARALFFERVSSLMEEGIRIVISARRDIRGDTVVVYGDGRGDAKRRLFSDFAMIELCPFTEDQLSAILPKGAKEGIVDLNLLKNPLFLSLYLELCRSDELSENNSIVNEAGILLRYFKMLYEQKQYEEDECLADLYSLGRLIHDLRDGRSLRNAADCIPEPLCNLFFVRTLEKKGKRMRVLDSDQVKYLNFMHGCFLKKELLGAVRNGECWDDVQDLFRIPEDAGNTEAYAYAGMLLRNESTASELAKLLEGYESCRCCRENVTHLLTGYFGEDASATAHAGQK